MTEELRRLLGGYAAGTLTEEERALLYEAALEDPTVFEAMADEQPLRDLLDDPSARAELLAAVQDRPFSIANAFRDWMERPKAKVLVAIAALLLTAIGVRQMQESRPAIREAAEVLSPVPNTPQNVPFDPSLQATRSQPARPRSLPKAAVPPSSQSTEASQRTEAPQSHFAPPPPPPAALAERTADAAVAAKATEAASAQLTWVVLRVDSAGTVSRVDPSYAFDAGDKARIRVESRSDGMLLARSGEELLYAGTISPGLPVVLRRDITFTGEAAPTAIDLEWAPVVIAPRPTPVAAPSAVPANGPPSQGVVGGVPGGAPSASNLGFRAAPPVLESRPAPASTATRIRIQLVRKKP